MPQSIAHLRTENKNCSFSVRSKRAYSLAVWQPRVFRWAEEKPMGQ